MHKLSLRYLPAIIRRKFSVSPMYAILWLFSACDIVMLTDNNPLYNRWGLHESSSSTRCLNSANIDSIVDNSHATLDRPLRGNNWDKKKLLIDGLKVLIPFESVVTNRSLIGAPHPEHFSGACASWFKSFSMLLIPLAFNLNFPIILFAFVTFDFL